MTRSGLGCLACISLLGPILSMPVVVFAAESLTLSHVRLVGTNRLSGDDVARGLDLKLGGATTRQQILHACDRFRKLRPFQSSHCRYRVEGQSLSLTISVEDKGGAPIVFDNFVWTTRGKLLTRLRHELPLFMPNLPIRTGLANDIIRVLQQVAAEHGIRAPVRYSTFWAGKGMNDFYVNGISTPIVSLRIEGENLPPPKQIQKWSNFCRTQNYSAAMLKWWAIQILDDLYHPRGYLHAAARKPIVQPLHEKGGEYPVRIVLPISSGPLFTFQSIKFGGLAKVHSASLLAKWKLKPGDPYNTKYVGSFISSEILNAPWARHSEADSDVASPCATIDEASKKVFLTITVQAPKGPHTYGRRKGDHECGEIIRALTLGHAH